MTDVSLEMYDDFSNVVSTENEISCDSVLEILRKYSSTVSVFDLMAVNAEMINETRYVQKSYKGKGHKIYAKYFLGRPQIHLIRQQTLRQKYRQGRVHRCNCNLEVIYRKRNNQQKNQVPINLRYRFALHDIHP